MPRASFGSASRARSVGSSRSDTVEGPSRSRRGARRGARGLVGARGPGPGRVRAGSRGSGVDEDREVGSGRLSEHGVARSGISKALFRIGSPGGGLEELHEVGEVLGVAGCEEEMEVIGGEGEGVDGHLEAVLRPAQSSQDERAHLSLGQQKVAPLEGPIGDFDGLSRRYIAEWSSHTLLGRRMGRRTLRRDSPRGLA